MMTSKLAHYRRIKGLSQEQLAAVSGVSARTIQRIDAGIFDFYTVFIWPEKCKGRTLDEKKIDSKTLKKQAHRS